MSAKRDKRHIRYFVLYTAMIVLVIFSFLISINSGSVKLSLSSITDALFNKNINNTASQIIWNIRLPRTLAALILGGALSVSGFLLQTFFNNPIAGPFVLGISSGAKLTVALSMIFLLTNGIYMGSLEMIVAAFFGSMISMGFVLIVSKKVKNMSMLVVCGVMVGYICSAITDFVVAFADDTNIINLHNWSMGSFSGIGWQHVKIMSVVVFISFTMAYALSKPMAAYQLGENYAKNMGVNIKLFGCTLILLSSILSACVTAFAGPVSFVGIAVPQIIRSLFKTSKPVVVIPAVFFGGSIFCLICDGIARTLFAPVELSISSVTAVFGAPVVIYMMIKRGGRAGS